MPHKPMANNIHLIIFNKWLIIKFLDNLALKNFLKKNICALLPLNYIENFFQSQISIKQNFY